MALNSDDISNLGEFGLIEQLTRKIVLKNPGTKMGTGDDAAVLDYNGRQVVITTDLLVEGIHFNLVYTPLKHLGYKAAVVNFSDVFAMNAIPRQMLVSAAISSKFTISMMEELYDGMLLACDKYGVDMVGGDTSSSLTGMMLSITAIGEAEEGLIVYRSGAGVNDLICVSGNLGAAYMGFQLLEREKKLFESTGLQPELKEFEYLIGRQLKPEPRGDIIQYFRENDIKPTSMIDISDGLSSDLLHLCRKSSTGCTIYAGKVPIDRDTVRLAGEMNMAPLTAALNGGEDYELLFTIPPAGYEKITRMKGVSVIGHMNEKATGSNLALENGKMIELTAQGWMNFR